MLLVLGALQCDRQQKQFLLLLQQLLLLLMKAEVEIHCGSKALLLQMQEERGQQR